MTFSNFIQPMIFFIIHILSGVLCVCLISSNVKNTIWKEVTITVADGMPYTEIHLTQSDTRCDAMRGVKDPFYSRIENAVTFSQRSATTHTHLLFIIDLSFFSRRELVGRLVGYDSLN